MTLRKRPAFASRTKANVRPVRDGVHEPNLESAHRWIKSLSSEALMAVSLSSFL
jgi:hypothetical protein